MATFNPDVPNSQAPNYQNSSQGTDRASLQPLASEPKLDAKYVQPHYKEDDSSGKLLSGLGNAGSAIVSLTDNVIKQNIDDSLTKGINDIRDSFGVAQAADLSNGIASAVGAAGQDGTSLAGTDPAAGQPIAINRLGNRIEGLTESYRQGGLSNSAYYAKMEAFVRQTKQQFPGYSDQIDALVSNKVGTTPANALRASLLQDVTQLQAKVNSQQNAQQKWEQQNAQYIYTQWPNYDQLKAEGRAPTWEEQQGVVGRLQARDYSWQARSASLAADKATDAVTADKAVEMATERVSQIASTLSVSVTNSMGIHSPADLLQLQTDIQSGKRPPLTPDEKVQVTAAFQQLKTQYQLQASKFLNDPLAQGTTATMASKIGDQSRVKGIITLGQYNLDALEDGIVNEKSGLLSQQANLNKGIHEAAEGSLLTRAPVMADIKAARDQLGDNALTAMTLASPPLMAATNEGFRQVFQSYNYLGKGTASDALTTAKGQGVNDANLNRAIFSDAKQALLQPEKFPKDAPAKSVQFLFGRGNETLIDRFQTSKDQVAFFTDMVSPKMVQSISKLDEPSKQKYLKWATDSFGSVFETQVADANHAAGIYTGSKNGMTLSYNPESMAFEYKAPSVLSRVGGVGLPNTPQEANTSLRGLNAAMASMKDVFKMKGVDPTAELFRLLPVAGIEPGTPIYKAIQDEYQKTLKTE